MCKKRLVFVLTLGVALLSVTACNVNVVRGSGDLITETREVRNFDSITLSGSGEVIITQSGRESLTIETDDNVMEHVTSEVRGGTLNLGFDDGVNAISPTQLTFTVELDDLTGLRISGSGDIEADELEANRLEVVVSGSGDIQIDALTADEVEARISGSGEITLAGEVSSQDISISGSGDYLSGDLRCESADVSISGSGKATVWVTDTLDTNIAGSGSVNYYGRPSVSTSGGGSGQVNSRGER